MAQVEEKDKDKDRVNTLSSRSFYSAGSVWKTMIESGVFDDFFPQRISAAFNLLCDVSGDAVTNYTTLSGATFTLQVIYIFFITFYLSFIYLFLIIFYFLEFNPKGKGYLLLSIFKY